MTHHVTQQEVVDFQGRRLSPSDLVRISDHLALCEECRRRLAHGYASGSATDMRQALFEAPAPESPDHVADDELAGYVDGTLDPIDAEIVASHLDECAACTADVRDLQSFRAGWDRAPDTASGRQQDRSRRRALRIGVGFAAAAAVVAWIVLPHLLRTDAPPDLQPPAVRVVLNDSSGPIALDADGRWSGWPAQTSARDAQIRRVLRSQKLEIPVEALALPGVRGRLRGDSSEDSPSFLLRPLGIVVEEDRPAFRWRPVARAKEYVVTVSTEDGETLVKSPAVATTKWTPEHSLRRGQSYLWQVTASTASGAITAPRPPEPEARFRVLEARTRETIEEARRVASSSHLVLGILYAEAGLLDEAERELTALATLNPNAALPKSLLADLRRQRSQKAAPTTENAAQ